MARLFSSRSLGGRILSSAPRFKVIGLAVGLALLALGGGFFLLSGGQTTSDAATHTVVPLSQRQGKANQFKRAVRKPAAKKPAAKKPAAKKPVAKKPVAKPAATQDGLPAVLAEALASNRIVVVSLFAPDVKLDDMAMREAKAGAAAAGAGFVALNVLNEAQARPLTKQLGVLEDPAVLVFRRPGELIVRFAGFADKQTVLQAARNAGL
jgi:hypothetical protein